jgi:hypothetical protein
MGPVVEVMPLAVVDAAARETATPVAMMKGASQSRWDRPRPGANLHEVSVAIVLHHHSAGVACQPPRRFRGNVRALLEHGLARLIRISERRSVDVDHDLIALARRARIEPVVEGRLSEQG